jgi:uncharacterized membrane protein
MPVVRCAAPLAAPLAGTATEPRRSWLPSAAGHKTSVECIKRLQARACSRPLEHPGSTSDALWQARGSRGKSTQRVMRQIFDFVKTTALGGAIFLLPFAAVLLVVVKAGKMAVDSVTPLAEKLPLPKGEAVILIYVVAALLLALVAFAAGLLARSLSIKKDAASFLEDKVLNKLPPYVALRKYTDRLAGLEAKTNEDLKPVLVRMQNGWQLGFLADAFNDGQVAVFMPGAPDPSSGVVQIVSANHITPLTISYKDALACLEQSGRGLPKLLASSSFEE